ncbi:GNAT family N-acetyltransferase [Vicingaceae bacterium]|nr:GNAT family N-acetyltransferase [Vicingaceae bacterium]
MEINAEMNELEIALRPLQRGDIVSLFKFQTDREAAWLAGVAPDPDDEATFVKRMEDFLGQDPLDLAVKVIEVDNNVAGSVCYFKRGSDREVTYWLGRKYWGRGIATGALQQLLDEIRTRFPDEPLFARVVDGNDASVRVLEKCGFEETGRDEFYSQVRNASVGETLYRLKEAEFN